VNQIGLFDEGGKEESLETSDVAGLFELSVEAYYAAIYARMSCLPIKNEISRYIEKVKGSNERAIAEKTAFDRGDPDVLTVLKAAGKVQHEIHRLIGLLRFSPDNQGVYIARCSPDHFILPALAEHFTLRFGEMPWAIIDEKRGLCLRRGKDKPAKLTSATEMSPATDTENPGDHWEDLWRLYHSSVNNESRKNLNLQRQLMPERYQKYLPEMKHKFST